MITYPDSFTFISDEVSQDLPTVLAFAQRHGFGGFELRSMFGRAFRDLTTTDIAEIKRATREAGCAVIGCATPVFKCGLTSGTEITEHRDIFRRSLETAQSLGAGLLRVFTFLRRDSVSHARDIARAAEQVSRLQELCAGSRMRIGVENESSCIVGTGEEVRRFLLSGARPELGVIWDPCNTLYVPGYTGGATDGFAEVAARVVHVHVKDASRRNGPTPEARPVGRGDVGWRACFRALIAAGFTGGLSLETHWREKALNPAELHLPGGFGFSAGGEAASEVCLGEIRRILSER